MHKAARIALWVCQVALALMFLAAGVAKFTSPMWARMFARWGYPDHFYLVVGAIEVAAGLALLVPRFATPASIVLFVVLLGAGATHVVFHEYLRLTQIAVMCLMLAAIAFGRRADAFWRKGARAPA